jgi:hypothetical protein
MDCFNSCCSQAVTSIKRADCRIRLPCSQQDYENGRIPCTSFSLPLSGASLSDSDRESAEVSLLGYLIEVATIYDEVVRHVTSGSDHNADVATVSEASFEETTMSRLEAWDESIKNHAWINRQDAASVSGLRILYRYAALVLHRFVRHVDLSQSTIVEYVKKTSEHARELLQLVQQASDHDEKSNKHAFRLATLSPYSGFAITSALDVITAATTTHHLTGYESRIMTWIASATEAFQGMKDFWHSAHKQSELLNKRTTVLYSAVHKHSSANGVFYFENPMQSPYGLEQDIIYGLGPSRYFQALGWNERQETNVHRLG